ncbi:MAG: hypothetical protein P8X47_13930 [Ignavibacteriaceae bacterium]
MNKKLVIIFLVFVSNYICSQTVLNSEKFRIYPSTVTQTEPVATAHPVNPQILFASAVTLNLSNAFKSEGVYVSTDGGLTWSGSDTCKGNLIYNHGGDPGVIVTESGRFIISHIGDIFPGVYTHFSTNQGNTWSNAFTVTDAPTGDKGTIAIDNSNQSSFKGRIYLAMKVKHGAHQKLSIPIRR